MTATHKTFELTKYIQKDLESYNRLVVYFNSKLKKNIITPSKTISNIILQVKTAFNILDTLDISINKCYINIYDNYVKKIQKCAYIKQNRLCALRILGESKSNLFGWSDQEDGDVLDKYMSQQNVEKYRHSIIDLHNIPALDNVQLCKEHIGVTTQCANLCKDTYICESYVDYKLKLDPVTCFIIREYVDISRINIMIICEFNEESKILPDKLVKLDNYINGVDYIIANA